MKNWKKMLFLFLAAVMLLAAGCESSASGSSRKKKSSKKEDESVESVEYEIRQADGSWYNENGDVLVSHVYEQVVLLGDTEAQEKINEQIREDAEEFVTSSSIYIYDSDEEMEDYLNMAGMGYGDLFYDATATVTHNGDGIFSIRIGTAWFMGGVFNADYYGMTFDLETGEMLTIPQLLDADSDEVEAELETIIGEYVTEEYGEGLFDAPERILEDYDVEDYMFYVEDGELIVTFYTYTFAPGAAGATVVPTGIYIGE